jgi:anti-sigma factor RsiW
MREHLTEAEITAYAAGSLEGEGRVHLTSCPACREACDRLRTSLVEFAAYVHAEADRPDAFFRTQREKIAGRLEKRQAVVRRWRNAWAPALAAAALLAVFLTRSGSPPESPREGDADQALLNAVQKSIYAEVPGALRPATMLISEVERGVLQTRRGDAVQVGGQP